MSRRVRAAPEWHDTLRVVWPQGFRTTYRPQRGRPPGVYLALPSLRSPIVLIPERLAGALDRIAPSFLGRKYARLVCRLAKGGALLSGAPLGRVIADRVAGSVVFDALAEAVPDWDSVVIRLGRRRFGRAVVIQVLGRDGTTLGFVKCGDPSRAPGLRREREALLAMAGRPAPGVISPTVLGYRNQPDATAVIQSPVADALVAGDLPAPVDAMAAFEVRDGSSIRCCATPRCWFGSARRWPTCIAVTTRSS